MDVELPLKTKVNPPMILCPLVQPLDTFTTLLNDQMPCVTSNSEPKMDKNTTEFDEWHLAKLLSV